MKNSTLNKVNAELAGKKVEIARWHSKKQGNFPGANYVVRIRKGSPQTMPDGTRWNGCENVGHYTYLRDAIVAAKETADERL